MNKLITQVFKSAGVTAKVSRDPKNPRFRVVENKLTLEGVIRPKKYTMTITDNTGKTIDNLSVSIANSNDVVNRINESINTLKLLSKAYDTQKLVEEDEEFVEVSADEEIEEDAPTTLEDGLSTLYDTILDVAEQAEQLNDLVMDDPEVSAEILAITSGLYSCAIDADELIEDIVEAQEEEDEDVSESVKRVPKSSINKILESLTLAEAEVRKNKNMRDIATAIKDIKAELIVRGK